MSRVTYSPDVRPPGRCARCFQPRRSGPMLEERLPVPCMLLQYSEIRDCVGRHGTGSPELVQSSRNDTLSRQCVKNWQRVIKENLLSNGSIPKGNQIQEAVARGG